jgi:hypothetical protein
MYDNRAIDIQRRAAVQVVSPQQARDIDALFWGQSACVLSYIITYQYMCYSWPRGRCVLEKCTARRVTNRHTQERVSIACVLYATLCTSYWARSAKRMEAEVPMLFHLLSSDMTRWEGEPKGWCTVIVTALNSCGKPVPPAAIYGQLLKHWFDMRDPLLSARFCAALCSFGPTLAWFCC